MTKLRRKIILGVLLSAAVVFTLTITFVAIALNASTTRQADSMTKLIVQYHGKLPEKSEYEKLDNDLQLRLYDYDIESPYRFRHFTVFYEEDNTVSADVTHIAAVDEASAVMMADTVKLGGKSVGSYSDYRYRVSDDDKMVVFIDNSDEYATAYLIVIFLSLLALAFIIMITVVFYFLSKRIVKPFEENSRMQKQFITDASHELKTPLAIISANAEVLAYKDGENEWINNITAQVSRISGLVNELLTLNRLEEVDEITDIEPVDLSETAVRVTDDFIEVFRGKNAEIVEDIEPGITINGNASQLERLVSVLVENASKYISDNGEFRISLKREQRHIVLTVFNSCEIDPDADYKHLFDRFYRPDSSRASSTGGHGIGLSVAKRIVTLHGGSIEAVPSEDGLSFIAKLSNKLKPHKKKGKKG